ncbi:hypothetical protein PG623_09400 [Riemerella anatipestifer]|nr:hypothetical protein [Riemerella anatipestifer]MDY3364212.1 hypothetical protein [Riemerella anatipestifer]
MDYLKKIDNIIETLAANNMNIEMERIQTLKNNSFTSTEILLSVGYELIKMISKPKLKQIIGNDVDELLRYCKNIGLTIRE